MTALCGGGPSSANTGVTGVISLTAAGIAEFISLRLGLPSIAQVLAPIIASVVSIDITAYCATDPPADPGLTALDVANAVLVPFGSNTFAAQAKVGQWFLANYWWAVCHCTTVTTPPPITPSNPGPVSSDPGTPAPASQLCWSNTVSYVLPAASGGSYQQYDMTQTGLPVGVYHAESGSVGGVTSTPNSVPLGAGTNLSMTTTIDGPIVGATGAPGVNIWFVAWTTTGGVDTSDGMATIYGTTGVTRDWSRSQLATTVNNLGVTHIRGWSLFATNSDIVGHSGTVTISWNCTQPFQKPPCCAPDPLLDGEIQAILQYVQAIYAGLPIPPHSFAAGTVHSGLTGNGSVTFSGVPIALKVELTTIPPAVGYELGGPNFYFDVGYLSFGTSEGNYAQVRLELQEQVVSVPLLAGSVGYTIKNGVVATITELLPGP